VNLIGMHVYLTPDLIAEADAVGRQRYDDAKRYRRKSSYVGDTLNLDIIGARGERAAQEAFPLPWDNGPMRDDAPDLGDFIEVKTTGYRNAWMKITTARPLHEFWAYVLCSAADHPHYRIVGWAWGHEIKKAAPIQCPQPDRPAYIVRECDAILRDARELQAIVKGMKHAL
jgi:hypothetical protein